MTGKVKRSLIKSFLNTGTLLSPVWSLIGDGVTTGKINYNPKVESVTYIHEDNASVSVESYAPDFPIEAIAVKGDTVYDYIDVLRKGRATLDAAETEVVNVYLYDDSALGYYVAERQYATISVEDFGGDGGVSAKINYTLNAIGNPTKGTFSPADGVFVADPVNTILSTLVIGAVTLTPLFSVNHAWLWYAGSVTNGTTSVTMTSTLVGATIVQKDTHDVTVNQGDPASLDVGVNHLTVQVTVGTEVSTYHIDITRAAS